MAEPDDPAWLVLRERGDDVSHVPVDTRARYDALTALFDELELEAPSPGWKQRALAALDRESQQDGAASALRDAAAEGGVAPSRAGRRARLWAAAGSVASAAVLAVVIGLCGEDLDDRRASGAATRAGRAAIASGDPAGMDPTRPAGTNAASSPAAPGGAYIASAVDALVASEIRRGAQPHRGDSVSMGDTWILDVRTGSPAELRVYGDAGEPLARCMAEPRCTIEHDGGFVRFRLELALRASGDVRAVLFSRGAPPAAFESLEADLAAAQRAQVDARQIGVVHVR